MDTASLNADNTPDWLSPWCAGAQGVITAVFIHDGGSMDLYLLDIKHNFIYHMLGAFGAASRPLDNGWALRNPDGRIRNSDVDGNLISDRDRFGNGFAVQYEPTPLFQLYTICQSPNYTGEMRLNTLGEIACWPT